jgi:ATP-dependent Zn protease
MNARELKRLMAVAHHEAGHAVVGWVLDPQIRPLVVTIVRGDGTLGHVEHRRSRACRHAMELLTPHGYWVRDSEAVMLFAGRLAEARFTGHMPRWGHETDYHNIAGLCYYEDLEMQRLWSRLRYLETQGYVKRWWPEIEAVAAALLEKKTLTLKEFIPIFAGALACVTDRDPATA